MRVTAQAAGRQWRTRQGKREGDGWPRLAASIMTRIRLFHRHFPKSERDRGDVPGWVLVTLMTAGLVVALWGAAGPRLVQIFNDAVDNVVGGP